MARRDEVTIDREERDGLYELVRNHLGSIEDFWVALERKGLIRSRYPHGAVVTPLGLDYETGLREAILRKSGH